MAAVTDLRIGIDVGGTNTDAAALVGREVVAAVKTPTTEDVTEGVVRSLELLLAEGGFSPDQVSAVMIGTTHFTNALVEAKELLPTAVVRLCGGATRALPPFVDWPERLRAAVEGRVFMVSGGFEFDGRQIAAVDPEELRAVAGQIRAAGLKTVAVSSVFSPVDDGQEKHAAEVLSAELDGVPISVSSEIGRIGLLERENATIVNACLRGLADRIVEGFRASVVRLGITAPLYLSQNDGTLMGADYTNRYPVATFASGPTNSMRGAAYLSGETDCAVIDVGGTTSDIGILRQGFPREASLAVRIAGVRTNFRMPDVLSLGIGGGSIVRIDNGNITVGPDSVGHRIRKRGLVFGGDVMTATDAAVAAGLAEIGDPRLVAGLDRGVVNEAMQWVHAQVAETLDRMKTGPAAIPVVLVGGGSILFGDTIPGASKVIRPDHFSVANAIGAAIAQIGSQIDRIVALDEVGRDAALASARADAVERCVSSGAEPGTVTVVDIDEVPLSYLPSNAVRLKVKAVGDLAKEAYADDH
jgi:N-methylhydantoinase A/oxoprolinase/acetone carboxylase beta subunit